MPEDEEEDKQSDYRIEFDSTRGLTVNVSNNTLSRLAEAVTKRVMGDADPDALEDMGSNFLSNLLGLDIAPDRQPVEIGPSPMRPRRGPAVVVPTPMRGPAMDPRAQTLREQAVRPEDYQKTEMPQQGAAPEEPGKPSRNPLPHHVCPHELTVLCNTPEDLIRMMFAEGYRGLEGRVRWDGDGHYCTGCLTKLW